MRNLWLRLFLAAVGSTVLIWQLYEWVWLPYAYDRETDAIESEMLVHTDTLQQRLAGLPVEAWEQSVHGFNQESDNLLELVGESDPRWVDLYSTLLARGKDNRYFDATDNFVVSLLPDGRSLLRNEKLYFDDDPSMDVALWLFVGVGILVPGGLLWWAITPLGERLRTVTRILDQLLDDSAPAEPLIIRGDGALGDLEASLKRVAEQLQTARHQWRESISAQRDLLHAVAHEFRSPIARLRFAQDLLADADDADERRELERKMDASIAELDDLVREVLGYSRVRHGGYRLQTSEFELPGLLEAVRTKVRQAYPTVDIIIHAPGEAHTLVADQRLTERAIINVVRNAARYAASRVDMETIARNRQVEVMISDDGPGIAPGKRERVFEPFTRLDDSRSRDSGGSGLGLAIVRAIMQQHAGTVVCRDSESGGAQFVLSWPIR